VVYLLMDRSAGMILAVPASIKQHGHFPDSAYISEPSMSQALSCAWFPNARWRPSGEEWAQRDLFRIPQDCSGFAVQIHIQERRHAGCDEATTKDCAIGSPVEACDFRSRTAT